jgi:nucleoside-diphosphate-sugar epimerase
VPDAPPPSFGGRRVLVTGATGFIGRWVTRALVRAGAEVHAAVRDAGAAAAVVGRWAPSAALHEADLRREPEVDALVLRVRPVLIVSLAGYGVDPSERDAAAAEALNGALPRLLAEAMARHGEATWDGQQVVHAGSALEYGTAAGDLREDGPATPTTLYGRTKLEGTRMLEAACARLGVRGTTARLFTVYGEGEHEGRLLPSLMAAARGTAPLDLTAGEQRRDFTWVGDVADGLLRLARTGWTGGVVNLATGRLHTARPGHGGAARRAGRLDTGDDDRRRGREDRARRRVTGVRRSPAPPGPRWPSA